MTERNARWAKNAPILLISVAKLSSDRTGRPNRHAFHDVGLAVGNLVLQASALGLYVHQMAGFSVEAARTEFQIPDGYEPVAVIAVGYLNEERDKNPPPSRTRKALREFVFSGRWARPSPIIVTVDDVLTPNNSYVEE